MVEEHEHASEIGRRLREVRHQRSLTLDEVESRSGGRFTAVAVGSWERADRRISAPKLLELADLYGVPGRELFPTPASIEPASSGGGQGVPTVTIDLHALRRIEDPRVGVVRRYAGHIRGRRGDRGTVLSLRGGDLWMLAVLLGLTADAVRDLLPAAASSEGDARRNVVARESDPQVLIDLDAGERWSNASSMT